jgi:hypothetical protein
MVFHLPSLLIPSGCPEFELRPGYFSCTEQERLLALTGSDERFVRTRITLSDATRFRRLSLLTPSVTDSTRRIYCCSDKQRMLRGGRCVCLSISKPIFRYAGTPLRPSSTDELVVMGLDNGLLNTSLCMVSSFEPPLRRGNTHRKGLT